MSDEDVSDVSRAVSGDVDAFERLYIRHSSRVHSLARRMVGKDHADDATQDVFIRMWGKLSAFRGESSFATWLTRLAVNVLLRRRQELFRSGRVPVSLDAGARHAHQADIGNLMDVAAALEKLDPAVRDVVVLHDIEGYSHEEIAGMLSISRSASKMRLMRARDSLRAYMNVERT